MNKQRHLGFLITKSPVLRALAPIIVAARQNGLPATMFCGPDPAKPWDNRPAYAPTRDNLNFPGSDDVPIVPFSTWQDLPAAWQATEITDLITTNHNPLFYAMVRDIPRAQRPAIYFVQYAADFLHLNHSHLRLIDRFYVYSQHMIDCYRRCYPAISETLLKRFVITGNPILDGLTELPEPSILRKRFGLPNQPIVLLLARNLSTSFWKRYVFGASNVFIAAGAAVASGQFKHLRTLTTTTTYRDTLEEITKWVATQGAHLAVKTRFKLLDPNYLKRTADSWHTDSTTWYPHETLALMSLADVVIHYNSTGIFEAATAGAHSLSINILDDANRSLPTIHLFESGLFSHAGIASWVKPEHLQRWLAQHSLSSLQPSPAARDSFLAQYNNGSNWHASDRIINDLLQTG